MGRTSKVPRGARHLRTYQEFRTYLTNFAEGRYPFLWIIGRPGSGKTEAMRIALRGRPHRLYQGGQLTALQLYSDCYRHRG